MTILHLAVELIVKILVELDYRSLLTLQRTCSKLRDVITDSNQLQCAIHFAATGTYNGSAANSRLSSSDQLAMLGRYETAWRDGNWVESPQILPRRPANQFRISGEIVACIASEPADYQGLIVTQLPSVLRGVKSRSWELTFDFQFQDFCIDASQDLLVLVTKDIDAMMPVLHILSLSTGQPHPQASVHPAFKWNDVHVMLHEMDVGGDYLGMTVALMWTTGVMQRWHIYNWKTGATQSLLPEGDVGSLSLSFLDCQHVAVLANPGRRAATQDSTALRIYKLRSVPALNEELEASHCCDFKLPYLHSDTWLKNFVFERNLAHLSPHSQPGVLHTDSADRLCVVSQMAYQGPFYVPWTVSVPSKILLSYASRSNAEVPFTVPWIEVSSKAHLSYQNRMALLMTPISVYGMMVVRCDMVASKCVAVIEDFHPRRVARYRAAGVEDSDGFRMIQSGPHNPLIRLVDVRCAEKGDVRAVFLSEDNLVVVLSKLSADGWRDPEIQLLTLASSGITPVGAPLD